MQGKLQLALISSLAVLLRCCVTYHSHSGEGKPPMYGDYEAQRHWQEVTLSLPFDKWYINATDNDLQYWGLDYPPLTAYHSLLLGRIASRIDPSFVKLHESRGFESVEHKHFMRLTVLIADILIYIPAIVYFIVNSHSWQSCAFNESNVFKFKKRDAVILTALIYPGLILVDHGHFQYNCVSLGLFVAAVALVTQGSLVLGSVLFVSALNYKQMELYHSLPFFFLILGTCTPGKRKSWSHCVRMLTCVSLTVLVTFCVIWMPFLKSKNSFYGVALRLFPFSRGVFEDKVANIWCAINVVCKLRRMLTNAQLATMCLALTTCAVLPSCVGLYRSPTRKVFVLSLINSALAFFLFSFQVHEKSILLAAVPVLLHFHNDPLPCFWFLIISHFSMLPLFIKDELYLAYLGTMLLYFLSVSCMWPDIFHNNETNGGSSKDKSKGRMQYRRDKSLSSLLKYNKRSLTFIAFRGSIVGALILSIVSKIVEPPQKYPDLFPLLISIYSCGHFFIFLAYFNYVQLFAPRQGNLTNKIK